jgi:hypothetical protein
MSFYEKIKDEVSEITRQFEYPNLGTAFGHFIIKECFHKIIDFEYDGSDFDNFIKDHIVDMCNDAGNDAIFTNQKTNEIIIFQFKFSNNSLLNTEEIKKNKKFIDWILKIDNNSLNINNKLRKVFDTEISNILTDENIRNNNYKISLYYVDNSFDSRIKTDIKALFTNYQDKSINFQNKFYDYEELKELFDDVEIPENDITLEMVENEYFIKKLNYFDPDETEVNTIVTSILANSLKPVIEDKKELILALNVRYYKGENDINSKIKREYSKGKKSNFWILNNGINAICEDFTLEGNKFIKIKNFQIVNGGQTTKTLTRIVNDLPNDVQILMRLTKIRDKTKISNIAMDIAVASNSQNAISSRDLHSGDRIQCKIFTMLDTINIFYDKKDGEWATITNKRKYKNPHGNSPMHLKINNMDLGISYLSFYLQVPISSKGRNKMVFSDSHYDDIFSMSNNEEEQFYKLMLSFRISEKIINLRNDYLTRFEILQNNYISDVILALSGIFFFRDNLSKISAIEEIKLKLKELNAKEYLNSTEKFSLLPNDKFNEYVLNIIRILQNILDVKKEAKKEYANQEWISTDTVNWLKKDETYKEIYEKVIKKLKQ